MPVTKKLSRVATTLADSDMNKFREMAFAQEVSQSDLLRRALLFYMNQSEDAKRNEFESLYAQQMKASTNRICGLMARTGIEVHAIIEFLRRMDGGAELVQDCLAVASKRLDKGLEKETEKVSEKMKQQVVSGGNAA
jgi:thymidine phosphorylase